VQRRDVTESLLNGSNHPLHSVADRLSVAPAFYPAVSCIDMRKRCSSTRNLRIIMNSPIPSKESGYRFVLMAAAILLHANNVLAAEFVGDAQMQARDLLSGTVGGRANTVDASPAISAHGHQTSNLDPQEQARDLILGKRTPGRVAGRRVALDSKTTVSAVVPARGKRRESDAQELARRMILGIGA
jgi:hypothetical protein